MRKHGFTLIEILIVIVLMGILAVGALAGLTNIDRSAKLNQVYEKVISMIHQARNYAINGRQVTDYTDANHNGDITDKIAPNAYGIYFKKDPDKYKIYLFADYDNPKYSNFKNSFQEPNPMPEPNSENEKPSVISGNDLIIESYDLENRLTFNDDADEITLLYYPPTGKFIIKPDADAEIKLCYTQCESGNLEKQFKIYKNSSGLPEK